MLKELLRSMISKVDEREERRALLEETHQDLFKKSIKESKEIFIEPFPKINIENGQILVISDLHIPYDMKEIIDYIVDKYASPDTTLVVNGDLLDVEALSKFPKAKLSVFETEYIKAYEYLRDWSKKFKQVILIRGNHEDRLRRKLMNIPDFVQISSIFEPDILSKLQQGITPHGTPQPFENVYYPKSFIVRINDDLVIGHPTNFRRVPGGTVKATIEYVLQFNKTTKYVVIGHTHRQALISHIGVQGYEQGCLCYPLSYENSGRITLVKQNRGYVTIDIENSKVKYVNLVSISQD